LVERNLAKVEVASSSLVSRSILDMRRAPPEGRPKARPQVMKGTRNEPNVAR
jgi:hypothetical protein